MNAFKAARLFFPLFNQEGSYSPVLYQSKVLRKQGRQARKAKPDYTTLNSDGTEWNLSRLSSDLSPKMGTFEGNQKCIGQVIRFICKHTQFYPLFPSQLLRRTRPHLTNRKSFLREVALVFSQSGLPTRRVICLQERRVNFLIIKPPTSFWLVSSSKAKSRLRRLALKVSWLPSLVALVGGKGVQPYRKEPSDSTLVLSSRAKLFFLANSRIRI